MADYLDIDDLKTEAIGLIFDTLLENLERHVFVTLVHEIYTESASYAEVREALFEVMFNDLIKSPRWDWDWINDLYHDSEFGRDLLFFWPIKEELVSIGKRYTSDKERIIEPDDGGLGSDLPIWSERNCQNFWELVTSYNFYWNVSKVLCLPLDCVLAWTRRGLVSSISAGSAITPHQVQSDHNPRVG